MVSFIRRAVHRSTRMRTPLLLITATSIPMFGMWVKGSLVYQLPVGRGKKFLNSNPYLDAHRSRRTSPSREYVAARLYTHCRRKRLKTIDFLNVFFDLAGCGSGSLAF